MASYPKRDGHFAHKVVRLMMRTCAAQEIGSDAVMLVVHVAHTEDAKRYTAYVTFWNHQLQSIFGFTWGKLDRARKRAMEAGWLHYERGGKGRVGRYWVLIPSQFGGLSDVAVDEDHPAILSTGEDTTRGEPELSSPPVEEHPGDKRGTSGGQAGDKCGSFLPKPKPKPKPKKKESDSLREPDLPPLLDTPGFRVAWARWVKHRTEIRKPLKPTQAAAQIEQFANWGVDRSVAAINHTVTKGWQGIREPEDSHGRTKGTGASVRHDPKNPVEAL